MSILNNTEKGQVDPVSCWVLSLVQVSLPGEPNHYLEGQLVKAESEPEALVGGIVGFGH